MNKLLDSFLQHLKPGDEEREKPDVFTVVRLALAAGLFVLSLFLKIPAVVHIILYACCLIIAGCDLVLLAIRCVKSRDFFAAPVILCITAVVAFVLGYYAESAASVLIYQIGRYVVFYVDRRSRRSLEELAQDEEDETARQRILERLQDPEAGELPMAGTVKSSAGLVLKFAMIFALIFIFLLPFLGNFSYRVSIHRALMILLVCTPMSVVAAMPLVGLTGLTFSAQEGVYFNKAETMEKTAEASVVVFDKAGIFSQDEPKLIRVQTERLDQRTFMDFAAHAVYYSEQPFAKAVAAAYKPDYQLEIVSDFKEIPGGGVEVKIGGNPVLFATAAVSSEKGVSVPQDTAEGSVSYYLTIAGRTVGRAIISDTVNEEARDLAEEIRQSGVKRCVLLTEEGNEESLQFGDSLGFEEVHGECDAEKKLQIVSELHEKETNPLVYVYANGFEAHSDADVDLRVGKRTKYADALVHPDDLSRLPLGFQISRRVVDVAKENAMLAFAVKAILVFLAMTGYSSLWFVVFADFAAAVATQLNSVRVTRDSVLTFLKRRD